MSSSPPILHSIIHNVRCYEWFLGDQFLLLYKSVATWCGANSKAHLIKVIMYFQVEHTYGKVGVEGATECNVLIHI